MMQFHGFLCIDISFHTTAQDTQQKLVPLTASGFITTNAFPGMSVADYGENARENWKKDLYYYMIYKSSV